MSQYKVALDVYNGPLDLLLFLIRRDEVDIYDIPIARITEQYLQYVEVLRQLDPEIAGEFLVLAATLMEIKSRVLLPRPPVDEEDEEIADPRLELVRQLLEYKKYKDAAYSLDAAAKDHSRRFPRSPVLPPEPEDETELEDLEIWDLFDAFNKLLEQTGLRETPHKVGVDDTPIALHADDILDSIQRAEGAQKFEDIFAGRSRAEMIGLFLALLELIRRKRIRVQQDRSFGTIVIFLLDPTPLGNIDDNYGGEGETRIGEGEPHTGKQEIDATDDERSRGPRSLEMETGDTTMDHGSTPDIADSTSERVGDPTPMGDPPPMGSPSPPEVGDTMTNHAPASAGEDSTIEQEQGDYTVVQDEERDLPLSLDHDYVESPCKTRETPHNDTERTDETQ